MSRPLFVDVKIFDAGLRACRGGPAWLCANCGWGDAFHRGVLLRFHGSAMGEGWKGRLCFVKSAARGTDVPFSGEGEFQGCWCGLQSQSTATGLLQADGSLLRIERTMLRLCGAEEVALTMALIRSSPAKAGGALIVMGCSDHRPCRGFFSRLFWCEISPEILETAMRSVRTLSCRTSLIGSGWMFWLSSRGPKGI